MITKLIRPFLAILMGTLFGLPAVSAAQQDPYTQAVTAYVTAAGQELAAIRGQIDAETKEGSADLKKKFVAAAAALDRTEKLLEKLKTASSKDFDLVKAEFERSRNETVKELALARRGQ
jgi:hypothetical protein